jgi:hypothetical protein
MATFSRFNARKGNTVELVREFYHASVLEDPYALIKVEIHKIVYDRETPTNTLADTIDGVDLVQDSTGKWKANFDIPESYESKYIYYDVWHYQTSDTSEITIDDSSTFKVFDDMWFVQDGSTNYKYQMFPDIKTFTKGEKRNIELKIVPLPLYNTCSDLDEYILPITDIQVKIETKDQELILDWTNVISKNLANKALINIDTNLSEYRKGVYYYWVKLILPNSDILITQKFAFNII